MKVLIIAALLNLRILLFDGSKPLEESIPSRGMQYLQNIFKSDLDFDVVLSGSRIYYSELQRSLQKKIVLVAFSLSPISAAQKDFVTAHKEQLA